jgi:hypothetical protein
MTKLSNLKARSRVIHSENQQKDFALRHDKRKVVSALPEVFSLKSNDYSGFVVRESASEIMAKNWANVGKRFGKAMGKVINESEKKAKA